ETEHLDPCHELALQLRIVELARDHLAAGNCALRRNRQLEHELALQIRIFAKRPSVDRVDRAFVPIEYERNLFLAPRRLTAAAALHVVAFRKAARQRG